METDLQSQYYYLVMELAIVLKYQQKEKQIN